MQDTIDLHTIPWNCCLSRDSTVSNNGRQYMISFHSPAIFKTSFSQRSKLVKGWFVFCRVGKSVWKLFPELEFLIKPFELQISMAYSRYSKFGKGWFLFGRVWKLYEWLVPELEFLLNHLKLKNIFFRLSIKFFIKMKGLRKLSYARSLGKARFL